MTDYVPSLKRALMKKRLLICSALILAGALAGCQVAPPAYHYHADVVYPEIAPTPVITLTAPPPPKTEVRSESPVPNYIWVDGVWLWDGKQYVWHDGYWQAPKPGYTWVPHHWHQAGKEWHMDGGHWLHP